MAKEANQAMETKLEDESRKFEEIREYISREEYPDGSSKSDKLVIRRRAKDYQIIDGLLHYVGHLKKCGLEGDPTKRPRLVISEKGEQLKILRTIHEQGHLGRDKVHSQVGARYYWKTLYSDVVDLGVIFVRIKVAVFAVFFCVGTIAGVVSTFFLVSPIKQVKEMLSVVKVICVIVFLIAFILTLCAAFWWTNVAELAVLFGIIQFIALGVYCVMLIPYAQHFIKAGCGKLVSAVTSS